MNNQSDKPGYGYQLRMGATSLTEKWDASVGSFGSQNHFMLGQINEWLFHDLAGIAADPDFKKIVIRPAVVGDLRRVKGRYDSVRGPITTEWHRDQDRLTLDVTIPPSATATLFVPAKKAEDVLEGGIAASKSPGVKFLRLADGSAVFKVASGKYRFTAAASP